MSLQQLLGIDLPLLQAPMAGVQGSALAIAVCEAGGLGALPCAMLTPDTIRAEVAAIAGIPSSKVAIKATTSERMGFTGRREGLVAFGTATIRLPEED